MKLLEFIYTYNVHFDSSICTSRIGHHVIKFFIIDLSVSIYISLVNHSLITLFYHQLYPAFALIGRAPAQEGSIIGGEAIAVENPVKFTI